MLHTDDNRVRSHLFCGNFGLEKESLRILSDGTMSNTLHPFPDDKHIIYDFCENQTEINTSVAQSAEDVVRLLSDHTVHIQKTLAGMEPAELLWPFSNPPYIRSEKDIPIARNDEKDLYRKGYPEEIQQVLSFEEEKLLDPEKRYAWRIRREFADGFVEKGLLLAKQRQEEAVNV